MTQDTKKKTEKVEHNNTRQLKEDVIERKERKGKERKGRVFI